MLLHAIDSGVEAGEEVLHAEGKQSAPAKEAEQMAPNSRRPVLCQKQGEERRQKRQREPEKRGNAMNNKKTIEERQREKAVNHNNNQSKIPGKPALLLLNEPL